MPEYENRPEIVGCGRVSECVIAPFNTHEQPPLTPPIIYEHVKKDLVRPISMKAGFILTLMLSMSACGLGEGENSQLIERAEEYLECDHQRDFDCIWSIRTPSWRRDVSRELFVEQMSQDFEGWTAVGWELIGLYNHDADTIVISYEVTEIAPTGYRLGGVDVGGKEIRFKPQSEWWKIDGEWYAADVGSRGRLSFSSGLELSRARPRTLIRVDTVNPITDQ